VGEQALRSNFDGVKIVREPEANLRGGRAEIGKMVLVGEQALIKNQIAKEPTLHLPEDSK
jgi:hypothetical protein